MRGKDRDFVQKPESVASITEIYLINCHFNSRGRTLKLHKRELGVDITGMGKEL